MKSPLATTNSLRKVLSKAIQTFSRNNVVVDYDRNTALNRTCGTILNTFKIDMQYKKLTQSNRVRAAKRK